MRREAIGQVVKAPSEPKPKVNIRHYKVQRGRGNKKCQTIKILTTNAAGLKSKVKSLSSQIKKLNIPIFTIQETHSTTKGKINISDYVIYEAIRTNKKNGGEEQQLAYINL